MARASFELFNSPVLPCLNCHDVMKTAGPVSRSGPGFIGFITVSKAWPEPAVNYLLMRQHGLLNPHASGPGSSGSPSIPPPLLGPSRPRGLPRFGFVCVFDFFIFFLLQFRELINWTFQNANFFPAIEMESALQVFVVICRLNWRKRQSRTRRARQSRFISRRVKPRIPLPHPQPGEPRQRPALPGDTA